MRWPLYILTFVAAFFLVSCEVERPADVIPPEKMEALLYDYHLAQSMESKFAGDEYEEKLYFNYVFSKHNVTVEEFEHSMEWYTRYPKHLKKIYTQLEERVQGEVDAMGDSKGSLDEGVTLNVAYLAADTAELWTSCRTKMLCATPLNSRLSFGFNTPSDSSFVAGDSLSFSFHAAFTSGGVRRPGQKAHAGIRLNYEDGTSEGKGVDITETGEYGIAVNRNHESRLASMSGFVYYYDEDTTARARLVLSNISVKRVHNLPEDKRKRGNRE